MRLINTTAAFYKYAHFYPKDKTRIRQQSMRHVDGQPEPESIYEGSTSRRKRNKTTHSTSAQQPVGISRQALAQRRQLRGWGWGDSQLNIPVGGDDNDTLRTEADRTDASTEAAQATKKRRNEMKNATRERKKLHKTPRHHKSDHREYARTCSLTVQ